MKVNFKMVSLFCDSYTSFTFISLRFTFLQLCYTGLDIFHKCLIKGNTQFSRYLPIATFRNNNTFIINFLKFEKHIIVIYQVQNIYWKLPVIISLLILVLYTMFLVKFSFPLEHVRREFPKSLFMINRNVFREII